jgi:hypothetical protein
MGRNRADDIEAVGAGHLHVEENQVGAKLLDRSDRRLCVVGLTSNFDVGFLAQKAQKFTACRSFVVHDEHAKGIVVGRH